MLFKFYRINKAEKMFLFMFTFYVFSSYIFKFYIFGCICLFIVIHNKVYGTKLRYQASITRFR